ncbi:hypothetical protein B0H14DRAFT_2576550 [Mycena olivaceomarginata]|nr:hypothetical protein B0H14DRAFT_2576550 [Mycena olivaceomarginata]
MCVSLGHDSSTDEWIIKFMPSSAYGIAANLLVTEIVDRYREEKQRAEMGMNRERMLWHGPNGHPGIKRTEPSNARSPAAMENGVVDVALHSFPVSLSVELEP